MQVGRCGVHNKTTQHQSRISTQTLEVSVVSQYHHMYGDVRTYVPPYVWQCTYVCTTTCTVMYSGEMKFCWYGSE